jgi:hypothetical protein
MCLWHLRHRLYSATASIERFRIICSIEIVYYFHKPLLRVFILFLLYYFRSFLYFLTLFSLHQKYVKHIIHRTCESGNNNKPSIHNWVGCFRWKKKIWILGEPIQNMRLDGFMSSYLKNHEITYNFRGSF